MLVWHHRSPFSVIGCDATITYCGQAGNFELNVMMPVMALRLIESLQFTANVVNALTDKCIIGISADRAHCQAMVEQSLAMVTASASDRLRKSRQISAAGDG